VRRVLVIAMLWAYPARADDALTLHEHRQDAEPLLHLDPIFTPLLETPFAEVQGNATRYELGRTAAVLASEIWNDTTTDARGYTAGLHISHDFGFARLFAMGSVGKVDSRFGSGTYVDLGVALMRMRRLSRWTTVWLSLGFDYRRGVGEPAGPAAMARVGFTFR